MTDHKILLRVVVAGDEVTIEANANAPLRTVALKALQETANAGRDLSEWEFKDEKGVVLDLGKKVGDAGFATGALLYLTLKVGINGGPLLVTKALA